MPRSFGRSFLLALTLLACKKSAPIETMDDADWGMEGGVEGGIEGGLVGGVPGGVEGGAYTQPPPSSAIDPAVTALAATFTEGEIRVILQDAGAEPRRALRYNYTPGSKGTLRVTTAFDMGMGMVDPATGQAIPVMNVIMPAMLMDVVMSVERVDADQNVHLNGVVGAVGVEARDGMGEGLVELLSAQLTSVVGLSTQAVMTPTGRLVRLASTLPADLSPEIAESMAMADQASQGVSFPLPDEPIGVGARWTVVSISQANALEVLVTQTTTLESLEGDVAQVSFTITQDLVEGRGDLLGLPPGSSVVFTQFRSEGAGQARIDLNKPLALTSEILVGLQAGFSVSANGETQNVTMTMRTESDTAPVAP